MVGVRTTVHLLLGALIGFICARAFAPAAPVASSPPTVPTVEMVRNLSELTTLRVDLADVEIASISGWCGYTEAALVIKGDFAIATDLSGARFESVDANARTAILVLSSPTASPPRLDHHRSRLVLVKEYGLWRLIPGDEAYIAVTNQVYEQAQRALSATSHQDDHQQAARRQAERVVRTFFTRIGWTVDVQWR